MDDYGRVRSSAHIRSIAADHFPSFEFSTNEFINTISCVTLETASTETGSKDFIAVGTTVDRGEDLAAKGSVGLIDANGYHYELNLQFRRTFLRLLRLSLIRLSPPSAGTS